MKAATLTSKTGSRTDQTSLSVMEEFYSIQGEGEHAGAPAYFIRLAGCDVGCPWCDTKDSWNADDHPSQRIDQLVWNVKRSGARNVVITGGEPTLHDLSDLTRALREEGFHTWLETSGAHLITGEWDWICLSPKKFKEPLPEAFQRADELKVIVYKEHDLDWGRKEAAKVREDCRLFYQPEWDRSEQMIPLILERIKNDPSWRISLQSHKYLDIP